MTTRWEHINSFLLVLIFVLLASKGLRWLWVATVQSTSCIYLNNECTFLHDCSCPVWEVIRYAEEFIWRKKGQYGKHFHFDIKTWFLAVTSFSLYCKTMVPEVTNILQQLFLNLSHILNHASHKGFLACLPQGVLCSSEVVLLSSTVPYLSAAAFMQNVEGSEPWLAHSGGSYTCLVKQRTSRACFRKSLIWWLT